ncbi:23509_t:CDS:1, partial [Gigaspora rosea]
AQLIDFTSLAKQAREDYFTNVFCDKNPSYIFKSIPVTKQEKIAQEAETNMSRAEIIAKIEAFFEQMNESVRKKYRGFKQKKKDDLLIILEKVRSLFNSDYEFDNSDGVENSET